MTTVDDVIAAARQLSPAEKLEIIQELSRELQQQYSETAVLPAHSAAQRIAGLDKGAVWMSSDFDDELPDEFWLGEHEPAS